VVVLDYDREALERLCRYGADVCTRPAGLNRRPDQPGFELSGILAALAAAAVDREIEQRRELLGLDHAIGQLALDRNLPGSRG
jgi:hypothetical protein